MNSRDKMLLSYHLTYNHYPPVDARFFAPAVRAIENARLNQSHRKVRFPQGFRHDRYGVYVPSDVMIEELHLEDFCGR